MLSGNTLEMVLIDEPAAPVYTQGDVEGLLAKVNEVASMEIGRLRKKNRSLAMRDLIRRLDRQRERDQRLDEAFHSGVQWMRFLGRNMGDEQYMPLQEGIEMGKPKIDRRLRIDGKEVRIRANSEEEYVLKASMALGCTAAKALKRRKSTSSGRMRNTGLIRSPGQTRRRRRLLPTNAS